MEAILIDRNFEFRPRNLGNYVRATIGIVCDDEAQLLLLLQHLNQLKLGEEYKDTKNFTDPVAEAKKKEEEQKIQEELAKFESGSITSLEI